MGWEKWIFKNQILFDILTFLDKLIGPGPLIYQPVVRCTAVLLIYIHIFLPCIIYGASHGGNEGMMEVRHLCEEVTFLQS